MDSIWFVYLFLPAVLLLNYLIPTKCEPFLLSIANILFLLCIQPQMLSVIFLFTAADYLLGIFLEKTEKPPVRTFFVVLSVLLNIGVFAFSQFTQHLPAIFGVSVIALVKLTYIFDLYRKKIPSVKNPFFFFATVLCFPCLTYGPINTYADLSFSIRHSRKNLNLFGSGASLFVYGLFKKIFLADTLSDLAQKLSCEPETVFGAWAWTICSALALYYLLFGYAQMAQGICRMLGFKTTAGFLSPFSSTSLKEFFRRFHVSLHEFSRKYIYIPLGGNRNGVVGMSLAVLCAATATTLWYGFSLNKVLTALFFAAALLLEQLFFGKTKNKFSIVLRTVLTYTVLLFGFVLFAGSSLTDSMNIISAMFHLKDVAVVDQTVRFYAREYAVFIFISVFMLFDFGKKIHKWFQHKHSPVYIILYSLFHLLLLFLCTAYMI